MEADDVINTGFSSFVRRDTNYRTTALVDSDDSDSSDEDNIWSSKRSRTIQPGKGDKPFVNPNVQRQLAARGPCSPVKKIRKNNIWGSILEEQTVTEGLSRRIQVDHDSDIDSDNIESYNYKNKFKDTRPETKDASEDMDEKPHAHQHHLSFVEKETFGTEESRSRKRSHSSRSAKDRLGRGNVKERVGERTYDKNKERPHITVTPTDSTPKIVNELINVLNEPKVELMTRVVETLGAEKSIELLYMTEDVEEAGGMMINNGSRRRTPGGVFLQLLRTDPNIDREKVTEIFKDERDNYKKLQRRKKQREKKWIDQQVKLTKAECGNMEEERIEELKENNQNEVEDMVTDNMNQKSVNNGGSQTPMKETHSDLEEGEISD